jgi:hypothetical protein
MSQKLRRFFAILRLECGTIGGDIMGCKKKGKGKGKGK